MNILTGFGYLTDSLGHITDKYILPVGEHPLKEGYEQTEVADQAALDLVEIWKAPVNPEDVFSVESFQESLFGALMQGQFSSPSIRSEFAQVTAFVTGTKQFAMLKQYLGWLISQSVITEADYGVVASILALQNIDLEGY